MGNPDLELQNPQRDPPRSRRQDTAGFFTAVGAGILLAIGIWSLCADATTRSLLRLQQQCLGDLSNVALAGHAIAADGSGNVVDKVERCAVRNFLKDLSFLDGVEGIQAEEFLARRDRLAKVLKEEDVAAFVVEPGSTFEYYANVSQKDWAPFEQDERPFLMVIQPQEDDSGAIVAKTSFLAPRFQADRVRTLPIPSFCDNPDLDIVTYEEHWNPYATLRKSRLFPPIDPALAAINENMDQRPQLMLDAAMRHFLSTGLWDAGFRFTGVTPSVSVLPQIKTAAEVAVLRAVNTASAAAVRAARPCLVPGLTEENVRRIMRKMLGAAGMTLVIDSVLFDENAALPHGVGTGRDTLTYDSLVTMEIGVHHLGYASDVTRSFFIDGPDGKRTGMLSRGGGGGGSNDPQGRERQLVWKTVAQAQAAARKALISNATAAEVDLAARGVIEHAGYGRAFPHRLGHGIGVRAHEAPYLQQMNRYERLRPGMVLVVAPGVYLEDGRFGMRLGDVYLVKEDGEEAELLSGGVSQGLDEP